MLSAVCTGTVLTVAEASAQTVRAPKKGLSASFTYGGTSNGKADRVEKAMKAEGFDDTPPGGGCGLFGCSSPEPTPNSMADHQAWSLGVGYRLSPRYSVEVQRIGLGGFRANGYREGAPGFSGTYTSVRRNGSMVMASVARHWQAAWLGVGPALVTAEWRMPEKYDTRQIGLAFDGGLVFRQGSLFTPVLRAQYWLTTDASLASGQSKVKAPTSGGELHVGFGFVITP